MNQKEKDELKQILHDYVGGYMLQQEAKYEVIAYKLTEQSETSKRIEEKVTKTNGKVAEQEKEIAEIKLAAAMHISNCPQSTAIKEMKDEFTKTIEKIDSVLLPVKFFSKYPWFAWIGVASVVISLGVGLYALIR